MVHEIIVKGKIMGKLSSLDIKRQQFKKVMRGYDPEEVEAFLEIVSEQYDDAMDKNEALKQKVIQLETKLEEYLKNEKNLNEILSRTREMQEEASKNLKKREEIILKDAEFRAVEILENARKEVRQIRDEIVGLQHRKDSFVSRLKYLIQSYMDLLKMMEIENLLDQTAKENAGGNLDDNPAFMRKKRKNNPTQDTNENEKTPETLQPVIKSGSEVIEGDIIEHDGEIFIQDFSELVEKLEDKQKEKKGDKSSGK